MTHRYSFKNLLNDRVYFTTTSRDEMDAYMASPTVVACRALYGVFKHRFAGLDRAEVEPILRAEYPGDDRVDWDMVVEYLTQNYAPESDEALAGNWEALRAKHAANLEHYSNNRGNDGRKVVQAVFDHVSNNKMPEGVSFRAWIYQLAIKLGWQFHREYPHVAEDVSDATSGVEGIIFSAAPRAEKQLAVLEVYRLCRQWLAFCGDLDETDRVIHELIDRRALAGDVRDSYLGIVDWERVQAFADSAVRYGKFPEAA